MSILSDLEAPINEVLELFFEEPHLTATITYSLYQGQDSGGEDSFNDFQITAVPTRKTYRTARLADRLPVHAGTRNYLIREADLPVDVTVNDLSTNDRIVHTTRVLQVVEIDKTLGFVIEVKVKGE